MSKVVGIDLGTTNSLVAYVKDGKPIVIRDSTGDALVPSIVSAAEDGTIYVGREAQRRLLTDAQRTVYSVKRFMGKGIDDVKEDARMLPFRLSGGSVASDPTRRRSAEALSKSVSASANSRRPKSRRSSCGS